jgi:hypothetical protein
MTGLSQQRDLSGAAAATMATGRQGLRVQQRHHVTAAGPARRLAGIGGLCGRPIGGKQGRAGERRRQQLGYAFHLVLLIEASATMTIDIPAGALLGFVVRSGAEVH